MLTRETLWRRLAGAPAWPLAWAMLPSCALPWLIPETWNGAMPLKGIIAGWLLVLGSAICFRWRRFAAVPLGLALAWGTLGNLHHRAAWEQSLPVGFTEVEGRLTAPWSDEDQRARSELTITSPSVLAGARVPVTLPDDSLAPLPAPGTPVRFRAELRAVDPAPIFLGERPLWRARSDRAPRRLSLNSAAQMEVLGPPAPSPALRLQVWARARFEALPLQGAAKDLWGAMALGIPPGDANRFSVFAESGTVHALVVSGLQMTLVMALLEALLRRLVGRGSTLGSLAGGLAYGLVVGFSAPVWRGFLMGAAWAVGRGTGWKLPPALGLHLALLLWLLFHPGAGCEPGFLLAWWALLGLLWGAEPLAGLLSPLLGRSSLFVARFAAPWMATIPLLALFHGGAPTFGFFANLLVLPAVSFLTPLCLALTLVPLSGPVHLVGAALGFLADHLAPSLARITPLATGWLSPWIAVMLAWIALAHRHAALKRTRAFAAILAAATFALLAFHGTGRAPSTLSLEAVDIGTGDALILRAPGAGTTVVDTGEDPWAARRLVRALSRRGVREPIHLVITHPHQDHAGGWATLARLWSVADTRVPAIGDEGLWTPWKPGGAFAEPMRRGDGWRDGSLTFEAAWPPKPFILPDANMLSLVLRARWRDRELWLMGDALQLQERDLLDLGEPGPSAGFHRALKVGHHGSRSSGDPDWLKALSPDAAIITAGLRNRFEHPHPETLATLRQLGIPFAIVGPRRGARLLAEPGGWTLEGGDGASAFISFRTPSDPASGR
ncbi:MAG: ComEC/Rec2 family competence protein [Acidobacteria bacterium]|nr:ComEC/Rec2 family competence protein [Acidobacteriota bacterium]